MAPVAINAFHAGDAVFGDFFEQAVDDVGGGVVGVDEDGEAGLLVIFLHGVWFLDWGYLKIGFQVAFGVKAVGLTGF